MKKQFTSVLLIPLLLFGGCASSQMSGDPSATLAGAYIGGSLGSAVGEIIGDNSRDWRGGYRGSAIGTIIGTVAGAVIGNAVTTPKKEATDNSYYPPLNSNENYADSPIHESHVQQPYNLLRLRNIRFIDDNRNQAIDAGESSKVIFEVMNESKKPAYDVVPFVEQASEMKYIGISPSVMIEEILPGEGIKYTATIYAGTKLKEGEITIRVGVSDENGTICDSQEFTVPAHRN